MNDLRLLCFLGLIISLSACKKSSDDSSILINIENEFKVSMKESLRPGDNHLMFEVSTLEELECSNYQILHSHSVSSGRVTASIDELKEPESCDGIISYAKSEINLGDLELGTFAFQMNLNDNSIVNEGIIVVNENKYAIILETEHGINFKPKELSKIPDGYFWGQINTATDLDNDVNNNFISDLEQLSSSADLTDGDYAYFEIDNQKIKFEENFPVSFSSPRTTSFIFAFDGDKQDLTDLVESYRVAHTDKIAIDITTSEGENL